MSDLRRLVTATNQLQEQLQDAVLRLEQREGTASQREQRRQVSISDRGLPSSSEFQHASRQQQSGPSSFTGLGVPLESLSGSSISVQSTRRNMVQQPTTRPTVQQPTLQQSSLSSLLGTSQPSSNLPLSSGTSQRQANLSSLFNWNPSSSVGKKRKYPSSSRGSKKKKLPTWTHTFVCLASVNQETLPDGQERADLQIAGLGEKRITLSAYADAQEIYDELAFQFSKLSKAGGFELLRVPEGGKQLDVIASPESGYTVSYLRAVVHHAKIYIRPMQKDLSLEAIKEPVYSEPPKEQCLKCGEMVSVTSLREHIVVCNKGERQHKSRQQVPKPTSVTFDDDFLDITYSPITSPAVSQDGEETAVSGRSSAETVKIDEPERISVDDDDVDPVLEVALHLSKQDEQPPPSDEPKDIGDIIKSLRRNLKAEEFTFEMVVRRGDILSDALRRMERLAFDPNKPIKVVFVGEQGSDTGGLTREFFRLIQYSIMSKYMKGTGCFQHNAVAYQDCVYSKLGALAAMSLLNGGASFRLFSRCVYNFLCGMDAADLIAGIDEVPDCGVRETLKQIEAITSIDELREKLMEEENMDLLMECGYNKPVPKVELEDKPNIIQTVTLHKVILASLAELSQFRKGLSALGVAAALEHYPHLLHSYFSVENKDELTSDSIRKFFTEIRFSEDGTNARTREEAAYMHFVDYLDDCERVDSSSLETQQESDEEVEMARNSGAPISLKTVLAFFTGADCMPPLGYTSATLTFNPTNPYPTASTCAIQLTLPTKYESFEEFKEHMDTALRMHGGFGLV